MYFIVIYNTRTGKARVREFTNAVEAKKNYLNEVGEHSNEPWLEVAMIEEKNRAVLEKSWQSYFHKA